MTYAVYDDRGLIAVHEYSAVDGWPSLSFGDRREALYYGIRRDDYHDIMVGGWHPAERGYDLPPPDPDWAGHRTAEALVPARDYGLSVSPGDHRPGTPEKRSRAFTREELWDSYPAGHARAGSMANRRWAGWSTVVGLPAPDIIVDERCRPATPYGYRQVVKRTPVRPVTLRGDVHAAAILAIEAAERLAGRALRMSLSISRRSIYLTMGLHGAADRLLRISDHPPGRHRNDGWEAPAEDRLSILGGEVTDAAAAEAVVRLLLGEGVDLARAEATITHLLDEIARRDAASAAAARMAAEVAKTLDERRAAREWATRQYLGGGSTRRRDKIIGFVAAAPTLIRVANRISDAYWRDLANRIIDDSVMILWSSDHRIDPDMVDSDAGRLQPARGAGLDGDNLHRYIVGTAVARAINADEVDEWLAEILRGTEFEKGLLDDQAYARKGETAAA